MTIAVGSRTYKESQSGDFAKKRVDDFTAITRGAGGAGVSKP